MVILNKIVITILISNFQVYIWTICPVQDSYNMKYWSKLIALHFCLLLATAEEHDSEHSFGNWLHFYIWNQCNSTKISPYHGWNSCSLTKPERNESFFLKCQLQAKNLAHSGASRPKASRQACQPTAGNLRSTQIPTCYTCRCRCYTCTIHLKMLYHDHFQNTCWMLMLGDMCSMSSNTGRPAILIDVG